MSGSTARTRVSDHHHGSPADRGSADAYYGRARSPHRYEGAPPSGKRIEESQMTAEEISEYCNAYDNETDRKDYR